MFVNQQMVKRNSNGRIVIKSSDNDVLLLSLHFYSKMTNIDVLWFQTGSITSVKDGRQFIPVIPSQENFTFAIDIHFRKISFEVPS
jgi:hypothetical protein